MMVRPLRRWVLIADETRARIVEIIGAWDEVHTPANLVFRNGGRAERVGEAFNAKPTVTLAPAGFWYANQWPRKCAEPEDLSRFVEQIVSEISTHADEEAFDRLVLVAPPDMMRRLKFSLPADLHVRLDQEICEDLGRFSAEDLLEAIGDDVFRLH